MNPGPTIKQASKKDIAAIKEIVDSSFPRFFRFFANRSVNSEEGKTLVTEAQGQIVGFAKLIGFNIGNGKYGCVLWLAVHPEHRRQGIAATLVKAGTEKLKHEDAKAVFASVQRRNKASLSTFAKEGFVRVGFLGLCRFFGWRVFSFYREIWYAPGEVVLRRD
jgi:N-acetylglutamate synthase-like GNAT family acetyltransferase